MAARVAFVKNTNLLEVIGLKDAVAGTFINDAAVTATIKDKAGVVVSGQSFPVTLVYVAGSNGDYRATLTKDLLLLDDIEYIAEITATATAGDGFWKFPFVAECRTTS